MNDKQGSRDLKHGARDFGALVADWIKALWLFLLYFCSITAVVSALSAYQLQHNIRAYEVGGQPLAIWRVLQYREQWNEAQNAKAATAERLRLARADLDEKTRELDRAMTGKGVASNAISKSVDGLLRAIQDHTSAPAEWIQAVRDTCCDSKTTAAAAALVARLTTDDRKIAAISAARTSLDEAVENYRNTEEALFVAGTAAQLSENRLSAIEVSLKAANESSVNLIKSFGDAGAQDAIGDFLNQINYFTTTYLGRFFDFATMPTDMLTLILVFAMGTLGGTIHLTRIYLAGEARGVGFFIYRPFLGAITALAIYILARAGVFVLSDPAVEGGRSPLSPFFISFLAIISGLLAEQALTSIENVGGRWFSTAQEELRWASKVAAEMNAQSKKIADIESLLGVDSTKTSAWLEEREPVPQAAQTTIAAWLQKPIRDLFTDLPPPPKPAGN